MKKKGIYAWLLPWLLGSHYVAADFELGGELGIDAAYTNNIFLSADNELAEVERSAVVELTAESESSWLTTEIAYQAEHLDFLHDRFEGETVIEGEAALLAILLPQRFSWNIHHSMQESRLNSRIPDIRSNREVRTILSTGPTIIANLSPVSSVETSLLYTGVSYRENDNEGELSSTQSSSDSDSDSDRYSASISWQLRPSQTSNIGLILHASDVEFDQDLQSDQQSSDYRDHDIISYYENALSRLTYRFKIGFTAFEREDGEDTDSKIYQFSWQYDYEQWSYGGELLKQLTDSSIGLSNFDFDITHFDSPETDSDIVDIVTQQVVHLFVTWTSGRHSVNFSITQTDENFHILSRDQLVTNSSIDWTKDLWVNLSGTVSITHERRELPDEDPKQDINDYNLGFSVNYRTSRSFRIQAAMNAEKRDTGYQALGEWHEYDNWTASCGLRYLF